MDEKEKRRQRDQTNAAISGGAAETVQRYGAAVKEHFVAYTGEDRETGQTLAKGLKSIAESKIDPANAERNINQQAGFSAEVKTQARDRAEQIISGKQTTRTTRTDDVKTQSDGRNHTVGGKNDQLYDLADITADGTFVQGTGRQLKYVGEDPKTCCKALLQRDKDKYRDADVSIEIPADFYDDVQQELSQEAEKVRRQLEAAQEKGNTELAAKRQAQLDRIEKTRKNLKKGKLTKDEAREARLHPKLSTAKDVTKLAHRAGVESARFGAVIGGAASVVRNLVAVIKDEKEAGEAAADVAKDTAVSAVMGYGTAFTGTAIKGAMQNAKNSVIRGAAKTNLPGTLVSVAVSAAGTMKQYMQGELTGVECLEQMGEQGTGMAASAMFAVVGQLAIPIPVIGGMIGSMVGYAVASGCYQALMDALKEEKLAAQERAAVEQACREQIALIKTYRAELQDSVSRYLNFRMQTFQTAFGEMKNALQIGDVDGFVASTNHITETLGKKPMFQNMEDLEALMAQGQTIRF